MQAVNQQANWIGSTLGNMFGNAVPVSNQSSSPLGEDQTQLSPDLDDDSSAGGPLANQSQAALLTYIELLTAELASTGYGDSQAFQPPSGSPGFDSASSPSAASPASSSSSDATNPSSSASASGPINNPTDFAKSLLQSLGAPETQANINSLVKWQGREGGNWHNSAQYNPLNTTQREAGSTSMNSEGVQRYNSWDQGLQATVQTLNNGHYGDILSALQSGQGLSNGSYAGLAKWSGNGYSAI